VVEGAPDSGSASESEPLQLVGFRIEDWRFAVRLGQVKTSIMPCPVTRVFHVPEHVQGIINLRGTVVGVLDLGRLLGLTRQRRDYRRFLVVGSPSVEAAIPVHAVFRLADVPPAAVAPLPPSMMAERRQYLEGTINTSLLEGSFGSAQADTITLVDMATLFDAPDLRALRRKP
jgi:purine-binding chemotaxis protein CheW